MSFDTSPEAARIQTEIWRRMGPAARLAIACDLSAVVRDLALTRLRSAHPDWDEASLRAGLASELYGVRLRAE